VGAGESGVDEFEFARRRLTAAAYGFSTWGEFREWRKRNPLAYREQSRRLLEPAEPSHGRELVVDLLAPVRNSVSPRSSEGGLMSTQEPSTPERPTPEQPPAEPGTMPEHEPGTAPEPATMPEEPDPGPSEPPEPQAPSGS
jgi:hypothetical protein